jgi:hypothetical protein
MIKTSIFFVIVQIILLTRLSEGVILMSVNECIKCTVNNCKHHAQQKDYCTLEVIQVGTHESDPTQKACTDCDSFELKF